MRTFFFSVVLISTVANAADAALGEAVYFERCASCHTASHTEPERKTGKAPDLVRRLKQRTGEELNRWVLNPEGRADQKTACDTVALVREPELTPALWAFLQGRLEAAPAPVLERRREALETRAWKKTTPLNDKARR